MIIKTKYDIGEYVRVDGYGNKVFNIIGAEIFVDLDEDMRTEAEVVYTCVDINDLTNYEFIAYEEDVIDDVDGDSLDDYINQGELESTFRVGDLSSDISEIISEVNDVQHEKGVRVNESYYKINNKTAKEKIDYQLTIISDYLGLISLFGEDVAYRDAIDDAEEEIRRIQQEG